MKKIINTKILRTILVAFALVFIVACSHGVHAQTGGSTGTWQSGASSGAVDTSSAKGVGQTSTGLQYTGTYCANFTSTIQLSSKSVADVLHFATCLIEVSIIPLLFAVAVLVFIYGVVKFISTEESAEKESGRQFMIWGIVALAVMFSVWGLVKILGSTFGVTNIIPQLPTNAK